MLRVLTSLAVRWRVQEVYVVSLKYAVYSRHVQEQCGHYILSCLVWDPRAAPVRFQTGLTPFTVSMLLFYQIIYL